MHNVCITCNAPQISLHLLSGDKVLPEQHTSHHLLSSHSYNICCTLKNTAPGSKTPGQALRNNVPQHQHRHSMKHLEYRLRPNKPAGE
jgi:hypothetical protein